MAIGSCCRPGLALAQVAIGSCCRPGLALAQVAICNCCRPGLALVHVAIGSFRRLVQQKAGQEECCSCRREQAPAAVEPETRARPGSYFY